MITHTVTLSRTYDVFKLIGIMAGAKPVRRSLRSLESDKLPRSRRSGFSKVRYERTDVRHPLLVDEDGTLIDGRHRLARMHDAGRKFCMVVVCPRHLFVECLVQADEELTQWNSEVLR